MHQKLFLTLNADSYGNAVNVVRKWCDSGHYSYNNIHRFQSGYSEGIWDRYYCGGKFSGTLLSAYSWSLPYFALYREYVDAPEVFDRRVSIHDLQREKKERLESLNSVWRDIAPDYLKDIDHPYSRSNYSSFDYKDDVQVVTESIFETFLLNYTRTKFASEPHHKVTDKSFLSYIDIDREQCSVDFIGQKWIVVIDYRV